MKIKTSTKIVAVLLAFILFSPVVLADLHEDLMILIEFYGPAEDITHNGEVDVDDISSLVNVYGSTGPPGWIRDDIDQDGEIEVDDIARLVNKYGLKWIVP
jgi:hypothetical protein